MSMVKKSTLLKNPGVDLNVSRVGQRLDYLENAKVGETIQFHYTAGSEDGVRTVLVQKVNVDSEGIEGMTKERDGSYRSYLDKNRVDDVEVVSPFVEANKVAPAPAPVVASPKKNTNRVRFDAARQTLLASLTAEQIATLYKQHVAKDSLAVSYDKATGEIVIETKPVEPKYVVSTTGGIGAAFAVTGPGGTLTFYPYERGRDGVGLNFVPAGKKDAYSGDGGFDSRHTTPAKMLELLKKTLGV